MIEKSHTILYFHFRFIQIIIRFELTLKIDQLAFEILSFGLDPFRLIDALG